MADNETGTAPETSGNGQDQGVQVGILAQYVKDLSFENPNAPRSLQGSVQPQIELNVNVGARRAGEDVYEVELKIEARAKAPEFVSFVCELLYVGLFGLKNVPEEAIEPFLVVEAPRLLFPFARRIIADTTRDGGFPPLMLDPIDFASLYLQQRNGDASGLNALVQAAEGSA